MDSPKADKWNYVYFINYLYSLNKELKVTKTNQVMETSHLTAWQWEETIVLFLRTEDYKLTHT